MEIQLKKESTRGSAQAIESGQKIGEMTFSVASDDMIIIDHTEVNPEFKGQGVGMKLLNKVIDWTRGNNIKIIPLCPFVKAMFERHSDLKDVLKK